MKEKLRTFYVVERGNIGFILLSITISHIIFILYELPFATVLYSYSVALFCLLWMIIFRFVKHSKKMDDLSIVRHRYRVDGHFERINTNPYEEIYQRIIDELMDDRKELQSDLDHLKSEMGDYYTLWAHQIKTPIASLYCLMSENDCIDKGDVEEQVFKIEQYVDMILQYLRVEDISRDLLISEIHCDELIRRIIRKYSKIFIRKNIAINYQPSDCIIISDEKWLAFVIEQCLSNALKYTEQGKITIIARDQSILIQDTGIGIAQSDLARLGEKGFTGYNGRSHHKSTGLGLYLSNMICSKLSHTLSITSKQHVGTTVLIDCKNTIINE